MTKLPDFIIIGAGKCGTTSLFDYLNQHPQIYLCPKKETFFFMPEIPREKHLPWGAVTSFDEYQSLFDEAPPDKIVGEISTNYYAYPESAKLIYKTLPTTKIIAILRDPSERAFSSYQMFVRGGHERQDFSMIIAPENKHVKRGFYYSQLLPFFDIFERSQIRIFLFDDFCEDPTAFYKDLCEFIGVDSKFTPDMTKKSREGGLPTNNTLNELLIKDNVLRSFAASILRFFMPLELRQNLRSKLIKQNMYKAKLTPEHKQQLIAIYRSDILQLQQLIGRDLSAWLQ